MIVIVAGVGIYDGLFRSKLLEKKFRKCAGSIQKYFTLFFTHGTINVLLNLFKCKI